MHIKFDNKMSLLLYLTLVQRFSVCALHPVNICFSEGLSMWLSHMCEISLLLNLLLIARTHQQCLHFYFSSQLQYGQIGSFAALILIQIVLWSMR